MCCLVLYYLFQKMMHFGVSRLRIHEGFEKGRATKWTNEDCMKTHDASGEVYKNDHI